MILERYIHREVLEKLLWITGLLILILTSHRFVEYLSDAAAGRIPGNLILKMLIMKMIAISPRLLPIAIFLAVILALTRLTSDREMVIMSSAGVSDGQHFLFIFKFAFVFAIFVFVVCNFISPWAEVRVNELKIKARQESDIAGISAGRFKEFSRGGRVVYVEDLTEDRQTMQNIFLQIREDDRFGVLASGSASFYHDADTDSRYVMFEDGHRYLGTPGKINYQVTEYRRYAVLLDRGNLDADKRQPESISSFELLASEDPEYHAELQWRASFVIATLLLPLFALVMNKFSFADNRYVSMIIGILVYFVYSNLISISRTLVEKGDLPTHIGVWWVHAAMASLLLISYFLNPTVRRGRRQVKPVMGIDQ